VHDGHLTAKEMFGIPNLVAKAGIAKDGKSITEKLIITAIDCYRSTAITAAMPAV
jgi:hypothetical protein